MGESPYPHVSVCKLLNDVIRLADLRKNLENSSNNYRSSFGTLFPLQPQLVVLRCIFATNELGL